MGTTSTLIIPTAGLLYQSKDLKQVRYTRDQIVHLSIHPSIHSENPSIYSLPHRGMPSFQFIRKFSGAD